MLFLIAFIAQATKGVTYSHVFIDILFTAKRALSYCMVEYLGLAGKNFSLNINSVERLRHVPEHCRIGETIRWIMKQGERSVWSDILEQND